MNEELNQNGNEEGKKSFYSVNLTEGKIILIFVAFVFVIVVGIFGTLIVMSNMGNKKNLAEESNVKEENTTEDYNFYSELTGEDLTSVTEVTSDVVKTEEIKKDDTVTDTNKTTLKETATVTDDKTGIDNSEVLYSSKINSENVENKTILKKETNTTKVEKTEKKLTNTKANNKTVTQKKTKEKSKTAKVENKKSTIATKKYVVQIGAFSNKKTANDILSFYQDSGYPTYIKEYTKDGKNYYRLRVGPFKDKSNAEKYLTSLKNSKYGKNSYISEVVN